MPWKQNHERSAAKPQPSALKPETLKLYFFIFDFKLPPSLYICKNFSLEQTVYRRGFILKNNCCSIYIKFFCNLLYATQQL